VGPLLGVSVLAVLVAAAFSFSSAAAPPEGVASLFALSLAGASDFALSLSEAPVVEVLSPLDVEVLVDDVVEVVVVLAAAASALVSVGGVIAGVLFGVGSDTLAPPHAPSVSPARSAALALRAARALTAGPCAFHTSGSR
jgi:hypothetical protein